MPWTPEIIRSGLLGTDDPCPHGGGPRASCADCLADALNTAEKVGADHVRDRWRAHNRRRVQPTAGQRDTFTPGPWRANGSCVVADESIGCEQGCHDDRRYYGGNLIAESIFHRGDARAIAEVPAMHRLLGWFLANLVTTTMGPLPEIDEARALIARVRGEPDPRPEIAGLHRALALSMRSEKEMGQKLTNAEIESESLAEDVRRLLPILQGPAEARSVPDAVAVELATRNLADYDAAHPKRGAQKEAAHG